LPPHAAARYPPLIMNRRPPIPFRTWLLLAVVPMAVGAAGQGGSQDDPPSLSVWVPAEAELVVMWYGTEANRRRLAGTALARGLADPKARSLVREIDGLAVDWFAAPVLKHRTFTPGEQQLIRAGHRAVLQMVLTHRGIVCVLPSGPGGGRSWGMAVGAGRQLIRLYPHLWGLTGGQRWPMGAAGPYPAQVRPGPPRAGKINVIGWPHPQWLLLASDAKTYGTLADALHGRGIPLAGATGYRSLADRLGTDPALAEVFVRSSVFETPKKPAPASHRWRMACRVGFHDKGFRTTGVIVGPGAGPLTDMLAADPLGADVAALAPGRHAGCLAARIRPAAALARLQSLLPPDAQARWRAIRQRLADESNLDLDRDVLSALDGTGVVCQEPGAGPDPAWPTVVLGVRDPEKLQAGLRAILDGRDGVKHTRHGEADCWELPSPLPTIPIRAVGLTGRRLILAESTAKLHAAVDAKPAASGWTLPAAWAFCQEHALQHPHLIITNDMRVRLAKWSQFLAFMGPAFTMLNPKDGPKLPWRQMRVLGSVGPRLFPALTAVSRTPTGVQWVAYEPFPLASLVPDPSLLPFLLEMMNR